MPHPPFSETAYWIWSAEGSHAAPPPEKSTPSHYQVRYFRREFSACTGDTITVSVSADSRFILYVNGEIVARGPAKGDITHQFYECHDLTRHLVTGRNTIAALVLDMSRVAHRPTELGPPCSVMTYTGGFVLDAQLVASDGAPRENLSSNESWRVAVDRAHRFQNDGTRFEGYLGYFEYRISGLIPPGWTKPGFDDSAWEPATKLYMAERIEQRRDPKSPYGLLERIIPSLFEGPATAFADGFLEGGKPLGSEWARLLKADGTVTVPPHSEVSIVLDAGKLLTGFPYIEADGSREALVRLTYAEALRLPWGTPGATLLGKQQSLANLASHFADESIGWTFDRRGTVTGWSDKWEPADQTECFEPLAWRAFRFVGLTIKTGSSPLVIKQLGYRFCAYPYETKGSFRSSSEILNKVYETGLWTMRLCSHETFEDCPHYEQMQYAGDTMITSKIAMLSSGDYALTKQAMLQFDWSRLSDGLTQSRYPSRLLQVIPSWSLHWITAIKDYFLCSGDATTTRSLVPGILAVIDWFARHANDQGLPSALPYWNITDWCPWWPRGVVPGADHGPTVIISAQYIQALQEVSEILGWLGDTSRSGEFAQRAATLRPRAHSLFWSASDGLYWDQPGGPEVSQYGNAWAIKAGLAGQHEILTISRRFPDDPKMAPGSFFWWHTGFVALRAMGRYDEMPKYLGPWEESINLGLSTFVEENSYWRSLCHAWSAHPTIECYQEILGVTPITPGFKKTRIRPNRCGLDQASGAVATPFGLIQVEWKSGSGPGSLKVSAPQEIELEIVLPDGSAYNRRGSFETALIWQ